MEKAKENGTDPSNSIRTLYIDRDPLTFRDISLHLQGYHVSPRDGQHFVRLFADAQFYSLPRLISQLYEESIFMSIGHREFQIPRDLFSDPGNTPNFFSLGFAIFFSNPEEIFPGLVRQGLIRPPSIVPPSVPGRSADTFAELLHLLRGYPVHIRDDEHRASLLRDCRYFNFKGLEQRLIPHAISFNQTRHREEIVLRLEDILKSGISVLPDPLSQAGQLGADPAAGWVNYARPFVDEKPFELVLEIGGENMRLHFGLGAAAATTTTSTNGSPPPPASASSPSPSESGPGASATRVEFFRDARTRITKLFEVIASKLNLPPTTQPLGLLMAAGGASSQPATPGKTPLSEDDWVKCVLEPETSITLDGQPYTGHINTAATVLALAPALAPANATATATATTSSSSNSSTPKPPLHAHAAQQPPIYNPVSPAAASASSPSPYYNSPNNPTNNPAMMMLNNNIMIHHHPHHPHHPHQQDGTLPLVPNLHINTATPAGGPGLDSPNTNFSNLSLHNPRKRRRISAVGAAGGVAAGGSLGGAISQFAGMHWIIKTGQWRLRIQSAKHGRSSVECVLYAVKLDAMSGELARNEARGFLKG